MTNKIKVIFFGTPDIGVKSLDYLYNSDSIEILAVVTQPDKPAGRGKHLRPSPIKVYAQEKNLPLYQPKSIRKEPDTIKALKEYEPDFFVTFAFGQILSQEVLDIPKFETINLHASLLPRYRGANPIQRCIINGDTETGICTMITELGLDCGDICMQSKIDIPNDMTCEDLWLKISDDSPELLEKTLIGLYNKTITPCPQCADGVCMADKLKKEETLIDWNKSAKDIHNLVRGVYHSPSAYFIRNDKIVKVLKTVVEGKDNKGNIGDIIGADKNGVLIQTGDGIIRLVTVKPEGKGEMHAHDWYNGLQNKGN